jgi:hypothetical protein
MARAFEDATLSPAAKRAALKAGIGAHGERLGECKVGCGVDRHLLALRLTGACRLALRPCVRCGG